MSLTAAERLRVFLPDMDAGLAVSYLDMAEEATAPASAAGWDSAGRAMAVALRAAHMYCLDQDVSRSGGAAGAVTSKREGDLAVTFSKDSQATSDSDADLDQTNYGRRLKRLIKTSFVGGFVAGGDGPLPLSSLPTMISPGGYYGW